MENATTSTRLEQKTTLSLLTQLKEILQELRRRGLPVYFTMTPLHSYTTDNRTSDAETYEIDDINQ